MRLRKWLQPVLLLSLGLYLLDIVLTGRIALYVNERFGWLSWIAAGILLVLGAVGMVDLWRESVGFHFPRHADHNQLEHEHDRDHEGPAQAGHRHGTVASWPSLALVGLPLLLGLLVPARPLGSSAVGTNGVSTSFSTIQGSGSATQLEVAPTDRNILDWVRVFSSITNVEEFNGQPADVIGFVYRDVRVETPAQFMVARFAVSCCVADASAIGVIVQWPKVSALAQDGWVHVQGKFSVQDFDGQRTPILVADAVNATTQPVHPYLYP